MGGHFGRTERFRLFDTDGSAITSVQDVETEGRGHFYMVQFLTGHNVNMVLCTGMGDPSRRALDIAGIRTEFGYEGDAKEAVLKYLAG